MGVDISVFNAADFALMDPFADPHLTLASYSVGIAPAVTVLGLAGVVADHYHQHQPHARPRQKRRHK